MADTLPGLEKIRVRFLTLLQERQGVIAYHALAAWDCTDPHEVQDHLRSAQNTLHQIAGSAGSLGFDPLGQAARNCENEIISYLEDHTGNTAVFPAEIMAKMDAFVSLSQSLLAKAA